jgi:hypothetical protein
MCCISCFANQTQHEPGARSSNGRITQSSSLYLHPASVLIPQFCVCTPAGGVLDSWHMCYDVVILLLCHQVECLADACAAVSQWQPADSHCQPGGHPHDGPITSISGET